MKEFLGELHQMVWDFRWQMAGYWPYRGTLRAARQMVSELGEALDVMDRLEYGQEDRTRRRDVRTPDLLDELADVAMMTLTAMGEDAPLDDWEDQWRDMELGLWEMYADLDEMDALVMHVKDFFACAVIPHPSPYSLAGFGGLVIWRISEYPGMDLEARLRQRLDRIFRRHHPEGRMLMKLEAERNGLAYPQREEGLQLADFGGYHPE